MKTIIAAATIAMIAGFASPVFAQEKPDPAPQAASRVGAHKPDPSSADPSGKAQAFRSCISELSKDGITEVEDVAEWEGGLRYEAGHFYIGSRPFFSDGTDMTVPDKCAEKLGMKRRS
ncbi:MAG: hypothetical protein RLZZ342_179 [Candidatus Parcubacteria bacterium]|jgi:hypothetical protein